MGDSVHECLKGWHRQAGSRLIYDLIHFNDFWLVFPACTVHPVCKTPKRLSLKVPLEEHIDFVLSVINHKRSCLILFSTVRTRGLLSITTSLASSGSSKEPWKLPVLFWDIPWVWSFDQGEILMCFISFQKTWFEKIRI